MIQMNYFNFILLANQRRTIAVARSTPTKMHITGRSSMSVQMGKTKNRGNEVKPVVIDPLPMETFGRIESFDPIVRNIADQLFNCDSEINEVLAQKTVSNKSLFKDYHNELMRHFNRSHEVLEQVSLCRQKYVERSRAKYVGSLYNSKNMKRN